MCLCLRGQWTTAGLAPDLIFGLLVCPPVPWLAKRLENNVNTQRVSCWHFHATSLITKIVVLFWWWRCAPGATKLTESVCVCAFVPKKRAWSSRGRCKAQSSLTLWSTTISVMKITAMLHLKTNKNKSRLQFNPLDINYSFLLPALTMHTMCALMCSAQETKEETPGGNLCPLCVSSFNSVIKSSSIVDCTLKRTGELKKERETQTTQTVGPLKYHLLSANDHLNQILQIALCYILYTSNSSVSTEEDWNYIRYKTPNNLGCSTGTCIQALLISIRRLSSFILIHVLMFKVLEKLRHNTLVIKYTFPT